MLQSYNTPRGNCVLRRSNLKKALPSQIPHGTFAGVWMASVEHWDSVRREMLN
jgi:hypothetical protein